MCWGRICCSYTIPQVVVDMSICKSWKVLFLNLASHTNLLPNPKKWRKEGSDRNQGMEGREGKVGREREEMRSISAIDIL